MALVKVLYVGPSDVREISPKDVKAHGVNLEKKLVWDRFNGFTQVVDADENFERILRDQGHFTLSEVNDDGSEGAVVAKASDPERVEAVVASEEGKATQKSTAK